MAQASLPTALALLLAAGAAAADDSPYPTFVGLEHGRRVWLGTCVNCHGDGLAGAPAVTDPAAWAPRLAKGRPTLHQHALLGFFGPDSAMMPPRGGNDALSDDDVRAAVDYMVRLVSP